MNLFQKNASDFRANAGPVDETLRLIANLPAPDGLAERVQARLRKAPQTSRILSWPSAVSGRGWIHSSALRGAAAAAIVCIVAGGGWKISSHIQPAIPPAAKALPMPARTGNTNGFSSANAIRTPQTLTGPILTHAVTTREADDAPTAPLQAPPPSSKVKGTSKARRAKATQPVPAVQ
jgi:hypothetical protein